MHLVRFFILVQRYFVYQLKLFFCERGVFQHTDISVSRLRVITAQKRSAYEVALDELAETIGENTLERIIEARILGQIINQFLSTLSKTDRVIFLRRYWYGDQVKDIARQVGITENAVSVRLNRLRSSLKNILIKEGYYE